MEAADDGVKNQIMTENQSETMIRCRSCSKDNPKGLIYCTYCGSINDRQRTISHVRYYPCPNCGKNDEFNLEYCVMCGQRIDQAQLDRAIDQRRSGARWDSNGQSVPVKKAHLPKSEASRTWSPTVTIAIASGVFVGAIAALLLAQTSWFKIVPYSLACSKGGVVVFVCLAQPAKKDDVAHVSVKNKSTKDSKDAYTSIDGLVAFPALGPGNYTISIQAPGHENACGEVTVEGNHPTVIGFPDPVILPPSG